METLLMAREKVTSGYNPKEDENERYNAVFRAEVLPQGYIRGSQPELEDAKKKEIAGLEEKGTWKVVKRSSLPPQANILTGRFVLAIENAGMPEESYKARYVVQGHHGPEKHMLIHNSTTIRHGSVRTMLAIASTLSYRLAA